MSLQSAPMFPQRNINVEGTTSYRDAIGFLHETAHQAILVDTLGICACGNHDAVVTFILEAVQTSLNHTSTLAHFLSRAVFSHATGMSELILHWLDELQLISHDWNLNEAYLTGAGLKAAAVGILPEDLRGSTLAKDYIALVTSLHRDVEGTFPQRMQRIIAADPALGARVVAGFLFAQQIIEVDMNDHDRLQLSGRGLQLAGMSLRRQGQMPELKNFLSVA